MTHRLSLRKEIKKEREKCYIWVHLMILLPFSLWRKDSTGLFWHKPWKLDPRHKTHFLDTHQPKLCNTLNPESNRMEKSVTRALLRTNKDELRIMTLDFKVVWYSCDNLSKRRFSAKQIFIVYSKKDIKRKERKWMRITYERNYRRKFTFNLRWHKRANFKMNRVSKKMLISMHTFIEF